MQRYVTLIIHGTFAAKDNWWRLASGDNTTFADRLESELARRGQPGTVWKPALDTGFHYDTFAWSGWNRHRDRRKGAHKLSQSLRNLAERLGGTIEEPLNVNLVAHSHGGNVVLEALKNIAPIIRVNRIALLGTPLISVQPSFRVGRLILLAFLLSFLFMVPIFVLYIVGTFIFTQDFPQIDGTSGSFYLLLLIPVLAGYGWIFALLAELLDLVWRMVWRFFAGLQRLMLSEPTRAYGPSPQKLRLLIDQRPILCITGYNDEADLLLQVGSTPDKLYGDYVATEFSRMGQLFEFLLLRPFVVGAFLKAFEAILQIFILGFPAWKTLLFQYVVAPLQVQPYYPAGLLRHRILDARPRFDQINGPHEDGPSSHSLGAALSRGLYGAIKEVTDEIKRQVRLRHSAYYDNDSVLQELAEFLTGGHRENTFPVPEFSPEPLSAKWEILLLLNVILAVAIGISAGPDTPNRWIFAAYIGVFGYAPTFVLWILQYFGQTPVRAWRYFWLIWGIWCLFVVAAVLGFLARQ